MVSLDDKEGDVKDMRIEPEDLRELEEKGFDREEFERIWGDYASGRWERDLAIDPARLAPPADADLTRPPGPGSAEHGRIEALGREAMERGLVGSIVLNGGMATRFGSVVKGTVEVIGSRSFLDLKLSQIRSVSERVPIFLMNSQATHEATLEHLARIGAARTRIATFLQPVGPRISPEGALVREGDGAISTAGMGHGDVLAAFSRGGLDGFRAMGGRFLMVSNVDNLGAVLDPLIVGMHLERGMKISVEVARRRPEDKGGMPVLLDGRLALVEGIRWPRDLDDGPYAAFNTNTFMIDADVFANPPRLDAYPVPKEVGGRTVVQFERILGEVTHFVDTAFLLVPAEGKGSRFIPVKRREDLEARRGEIEACMSAWGVL